MQTYENLFELNKEHQKTETLKTKSLINKELYEWEEKCKKVMKNLDSILEKAVKNGNIEQKLIRVELPNLAYLGDILTKDPTRRSTWGGGSYWITVKPYVDKSFLINPCLIELWEMIQLRNLRPIFMEGPFGTAILGVQLPDGGEYPRNDTAGQVAWRTSHQTYY